MLLIYEGILTLPQPRQLRLAPLTKRIFQSMLTGLGRSGNTRTHPSACPAACLSEVARKGVAVQVLAGAATCTDLAPEQGGSGKFVHRREHSDIRKLTAWLAPDVLALACPRLECRIGLVWRCPRQRHGWAGVRRIHGARPDRRTRYGTAVTGDVCLPTTRLKQSARGARARCASTY